MRIDAWIWAVRLVKTRTLATAACRAGHVKVNGVAVKPAFDVKVGDRVRVWINHWEHIVVVKELHTKRVGAPVAKQAYEDHTPERIMPMMPRRDPGAGRPTKKERREMEKFRRMN